MNRRVIVRSFATFACVLAIAGWPDDVLRATVSEALCDVLAPLLSSLEFGHGGRAELRVAPVQSVRRANEQVSSDATLQLQVKGAPQRLAIGVNLRRDFYLPLLTFCATVLAYPAARRTRAAALLLGLPLALYACFGAFYATTCWLFAHRMPSIYPTSAVELALLDRVIGTFVAPPTLRYFVPMLIALSMLALVRHTGVLPSSSRASSALGLDQDEQTAAEQ